MNCKDKMIYIRDIFGFNDKELLSILNIDINTIEDISVLFKISLNKLKKSKLTRLKLVVTLDKSKYKNVFSPYKDILEIYNKYYVIYNLVKFPRRSIFTSFIDFLSGSDYYLSKSNDFIPYYLLVKDNIKLLLHIDNYILSIEELPSNIDIQRFKTRYYLFKNRGKYN